MITNIEDFNGIYEQYHVFSAGVANRLVRDRSLAEDICQDVFYKLYTTNVQIDLSDERKLRALILRATVNMAKDYLRKAYKKWESLELDDQSWKEIEDKQNIPEAKMLYMEEREYRKLVLERLRDENPVNYEILIKTKILDIPAEIVAAEYGISLHNVHSRIHRTKKWLDDEMKKVYGNKRL